jgi:hypothetical protein
MSYRDADGSSDLTAEFAEERRDARFLGVTPRPLRFIACRKSHGSNTDETRIKDERIEQEQTERTEREPNLRFLCYLLLTTLTADYADTRGWAIHLVRIFIRAYPRHPRFFFIIPQIDILRGVQRDKRFVVRKETTNGTNHTNEEFLYSCDSCYSWLLETTEPRIKRGRNTVTKTDEGGINADDRFARHFSAPDFSAPSFRPSVNGGSIRLTAEIAEKRRETRRLCVSRRPLRFITCWSWATSGD